MKKTKIIIPALGILLLSTAASVTGTVAWFTANNTVTADTMTIKAVVSGNLFIKEGAAVEYAQINATHADITMTARNLNPAEMVASGGTVNVEVPTNFTGEGAQAPTIDSAGHAVNFTNIGAITATTAADATKSYVATAFVSIANKQTNASTFGLKPTCTVTVNNASFNLAGALRAGIIIKADDDSINKYFESSDASVSGQTVTLAFNGSTQYATGLKDNVAHRVALMVWYEGEDEDCYVNNAVNLADCTATWSLTSAIA